MKRYSLILGSLVLSVLLLSLNLGTVSAQGLQENTKGSAGAMTLKGKVVGFDDRFMVIRDEFGIDHDLAWDKNTVFVHKNKKLKAKDCKIGYPVELEARRHNGKLTVRRVRINEILQPYIKPAKEPATEKIILIQNDEIGADTSEIEIIRPDTSDSE